jgi:hypothetical protein
MMQGKGTAAPRRSHAFSSHFQICPNPVSDQFGLPRCVPEPLVAQPQHEHTAGEADQGVPRMRIHAGVTDGTFG